MTLSYDEIDDFDDEPEDSLSDEGDDSVDLEDHSTTLSQTFHEATEAEEKEEQYEEEKEDSAEEEDDDDTDAYEQRLTETLDVLQDEESLEGGLPSTEASLEVQPFQSQEQSNHAYADAVTAYYEEKDYQRAIEKFSEAIENETQSTPENVTDSNEIVAKAMYWQAEAYIKMEDIPQAIITLENLVQTCRGHYLSLAAQRRAAQLNLEDS